jgi:hypothetical protein
MATVMEGCARILRSAGWIVPGRTKGLSLRSPACQAERVLGDVRFDERAQNLFQIRKNFFPGFQIRDFTPSVCQTAGVKYALQKRTLRHFGPVKAREIGNFRLAGGRSQNPFAWFLSRDEPLIGAPDAL